MTRKEFDKIVQAYIDREKASIEEHNQIAAILLQAEGKLISKRAFPDKLLGDSFKFAPQYGMYYIKGPLHDHLIGYEGSENFVAVNETHNHRGFEYLDACSGSAAEARIKQIQSTDLDKAFKIFNQVEKHFNAIRVLFGDIEREGFGSFSFPPYYAVLNGIYPPADNNSYANALKLTDFYFIRK